MYWGVRMLIATHYCATNAISKTGNMEGRRANALVPLNNKRCLLIMVQFFLAIAPQVWFSLPYSSEGYVKSCAKTPDPEQTQVRTQQLWGWKPSFYSCHRLRSAAQVWPILTSLTKPVLLPWWRQQSAPVQLYLNLRYKTRFYPNVTNGLSCAVQHVSWSPTKTKMCSIRRVSVTYTVDLHSTALCCLSALNGHMRFPVGWRLLLLFSSPLRWSLATKPGESDYSYYNVDKDL